MQRLDDADKHSVSLTVRFTPGEYKDVKEFARKTKVEGVKISMNAMIRGLVFKHIEKYTTGKKK